MPMNMFVNAPGSTNTYGLPVSPATASAMRVLPVPGGPQSSRPLGTYPPRRSISSGRSRKTMFSLTRSTTWSCPHTSWKRVLMSSGKYVSTPPLDRNQNRPTNWMMTKKNRKTICRKNGSACQISAGAWSSAANGLMSRTAPSTRAIRVMKKTILSALARRKRVQSSKRRWVQRSKPPKTFWLQKRW